MADLKISQLTGATTPLAGSEEVPIVQSGSTKKVTVANLTAGRAVTASTVGAGTTVPANYTLATNGPLHFSSASFPGNPSAGTGAAYGSAANGIVFLGNGSTYDLLLGNKNADECISVATGQRAVKFWDNAIIGTAAKGVNFTANTPAAGMTSQLLNWYEEGTWTPSVGGNATYTVQTGYYTRIGNFVKLRFHLTINVLGTGSTTNISGMPFTPSSNDPSIVGGVVCYANNLAVAALSLGIYAQSDGLIRFFTRDTSSTGATTQYPAVIGNGFDVYAEISYQI